MPAMNILSQLAIKPSTHFTLADIPKFPLEVYNRQIDTYDKCESWFSGDALDKQASAGKTKDLYPLKINPLISTVLKHAYILFGEVSNNSKPLVYPKIIPHNSTKEAKNLAKEAEEALYTVWWENTGRSLMMENGIISQIYGGCVFRATYVPWETWRVIPIRIERIHPKSFVGRPSAGDMFRLQQGWLISHMSTNEARKWGYTGDENNPTYVEYWDKEERKAWLNKDEAKFPVAIPDQDKNKYGLNAPNDFGFVPLVYIPHIRMGGFYGTNAIDHLVGLIKELNLRFGDFGDAVNDDSHTPLAMTNVNGTPQQRKIASGVTVLDLGSSASVTGNEKDPNIKEIGRAKASPSMQNLLGELIKQYRRDSFVPAVAEGEDEGSQRSALTLATRFWPLTSHAGMERVFFGDGLDVFNAYLLRMMAARKLHGITEEHTKMRMKQSWAPLLPRDREAEVQEWGIRASNDIASIEHLIDLSRDVDDAKTERENILKWRKDMTQVEADAKAKAAQKYPAPTPFGLGGSSSGKQPGRPATLPEKTPTQKRGGGGGKDA
mgnify:CR=1 FL=1